MGDSTGSDHAGPPVGRVAGTEDSTPLQFSVALDEGAYLQLDDVVVTERAVPGRGLVATAGVVTEVRARHEGATYGSDVFLIEDGVLPGAGAGDRRDHHHPRRPGGLRPAAAGRLRLPGHRRGARQGAVLRPDGAQGRGRARPRWRPDLPEPGVPGRHARRPRLDQRHLRGRHQDELRAVPAVLALHAAVRWAAARSTPRRWCSASRAKICCSSTTRTASWTTSSARIYARLGLTRRRSRRSGSSRRRCRTTSPAARTSPAAPAASPRSGGRWPSSAPASCCPTFSPTPRTSATSTRW